MEEEKSIAGLVKYISRYKPEFVREMSPADSSLVSEFKQIAEKLTGFPLPPDYLEFLAQMGGKPPLAFAYDAGMELSEVLETYKIRLADSENLPTNCHLIAAGGYQIEQAALECAVDENGTLRSGRVYSAAGDELKYLMADSFLGLLFRRAFEICAAAHLPVTATYIGTTKEPTLEIIADLIEGFGWHKHWFSDSVTLSMSDERNDLILYSEQPLNDYNWLKIAGKNRNQISLIGEQLARLAAMEFEKWWN